MLYAFQMLLMRIHLYIRNHLLKIFTRLHDKFGVLYSICLNEGKINRAKIISLSLPRNGIKPIRCLNQNQGHILNLDSIQNFYSTASDISSSNTKVLILAPKKFGLYPNVIFEQLKIFFLEQEIEFIWICLNELETDYLEYVTKTISMLSRESKLTIIFDPLSPYELYPRYLSMDYSWFESQKNKYDFSLIAFLGDIWRRKDYERILPWANVVKTFFHVDQIAALRFPTEISMKMVFYPFVSLPLKYYSTQFNLEKSHQVFFSGQVRDSDRRWWLNKFSTITKNLEIPFVVNSWYKYRDSEVLSRASYLAKLTKSSACLGLSQRGLNHWILPARSFETLRSGTALIQQEGPNCSPARTFLKPYHDYIPFTSLNELQSISNTILKDFNELQKIAKNGQETIRINFPAKYFLNLIFKS